MTVTYLAEKMTEMGRPTDKGKLSKIERGLWTSPLGTRDIESAALALGIQPAALLVGAGTGELIERFVSGGEGSAMAYLAERISRLLGKPPSDPG